MYRRIWIWSRSPKIKYVYCSSIIIFQYYKFTVIILYIDSDVIVFLHIVFLILIKSIWRKCSLEVRLMGNLSFTQPCYYSYNLQEFKPYRLNLFVDIFMVFTTISVWCNHYIVHFFHCMLDDTLDHGEDTFALQAFISTMRSQSLCYQRKNVFPWIYVLFQKAAFNAGNRKDQKLQASVTMCGCLLWSWLISIGILSFFGGGDFLRLFFLRCEILWILEYTMYNTLTVLCTSFSMLKWHKYRTVLYCLCVITVELNRTLL